MRKTLTYAITAFMLALGWVVVAQAADDLTDDDRKVLDNSREVLSTLTSAPDDAIPEELLERAECVMVFPNVTKGAFIVGGRYGRGVVSCRDETGILGAPAYFSIGGASIGWQWGGQQTDFVMLVMNKRGMRHLLESKLTIGGEAAATAGPVGRTAEAATDAQMQAQILSWSRSQGVFLGASLEGAIIQQSEDANQRMYGEERTAKEILTSQSTVPMAARGFIELARSVTEPKKMGHAKAR